jgi:DNA-binding LacI/PurR family transcriptional regulator
MGYRPNAIAQSLRSKQTNIIGFYTQPSILDTRQEFFGYLFGGLQRGCEIHHVDILVHKSFEGRSAEDIYGEMMNGRIDGAVVYINHDDPLAPLLQKSTLPVIALADSIKSIASVACHDDLGMRRLLDYLWNKGYRSFAFLAPEHLSVSVMRRQTAFTDYLTTNGVPLGHQQVITLENGCEGQVIEQALHNDTFGPTVLCCWCDYWAYAALRYCRIKSIRVPDDLAVVGFDGFVDTKLPLLDLVTIRVPWYDLAQSAVDLLMNRINGCDIMEETLLPVDFVPGNTA